MGEKRHKSTRAAYIIKSLLFTTYLAFLFWRMFFYAYNNLFRIQSKAYEYNIIPLKTIYSLLTGYSKYGFTVWGYNLFGNIAVFVPVGFLLVALQRKKKKTMLAVTVSFFIILFAELMQLLMKVGVFDVDDIILNLIGTLIGCFLYKAILSVICKYRYRSKG